jgi:hypothetical protein
VFGGDAQVRQFIGFEGDVLPFGVLVAFDDLRAVYRVSGLVRVALDGAGEDLLVADALAGAAVDLVEADVGLRLGGWKELDAEADQRDLNSSGPVGSWSYLTAQFAIR